MPIIIFSCTKSLYLIQCSHLEHFYRFFKSGIPEKPYITRVFLVVPIISLTPTKNICCIFPVSLFSLLSSSTPFSGVVWFSCGFFSSLFLLFSYPIHPVSYTLIFSPLLNFLFKPDLSGRGLVKVMRNSTYKVGWKEWGTNRFGKGVRTEWLI